MDDASTAGEIAVIVVPVLGTLVGLLIGWLAGRGRERREMRRSAYLSWWRAARLLGRLDGPAPTSPQGFLLPLSLPTPQRLTDVNNASLELQLVASETVIEAARALINYFVSPEFRSAVGARPYKTVGEAYEHIDKLTKPLADRMLKAMRRDLKSLW